MAWAFPRQTLYVCLSGDFSTTDYNKLVKHHNKRHKEFNKMAYNFNDEDKEGGDFMERLPFGVSDVVIQDIRSGQTDSGSDYIELDVANLEDVRESVRVWFTEKSAKYSFQTLRQIAVHNAGDADKEKARMAVEAVKDSDELVELFKKNLMGAQAWVEKYYDPIRTYQGSDGNEYRSVNTNLRGYKPKLKPELMDSKTDVQTDAVTDAFPGAEAANAADIPPASAWGK